LKKILNKVLSLDLVKVSGLTAISTAVKVLTSFGLSKYMALMIGPTGLALIGQLSNVIQLMTTGGSLATRKAVTKYTAEYKESEETYLDFIGTSFKMVCASSLIVSLFCFFSAEWLSNTTFKSSEYKSVFQIFSFNILLFTLNGVTFSVVNGLKKFKKYVKLSIISNVLTAFVTIGLIWAYGIYGGLVSYVCAQSVVFFITAWLTRKELMRILVGWKRYTFSSKFAKLLVSFSLMTFVALLLAPLSKLFIRSQIITDIDITSAGIWEGINRITNLFLLFFHSTIPIYYLPKLSEMKNDTDLRAEVNLTFKIVVPVVIVMALVVFLLRYYVIIIALSDDFLPMMDLFGYQLLGDIFRVVSLVYVYTLIAKAKIKHYLILEILTVGLYMGLSYLLIGSIGLKGAIIGYAITYGLYALSTFVSYRKVFNGD